MAVASPTPALLLDALAVVFRWRRLILLTTLAAAIVSSIIALSLPNLYPATTSFYSTNLEAADPDVLAGGEKKVLLLPKPEDLDRAVNIGQSQPVVDFLIKKYHLATEWRIDKGNGKTDPVALAQAVREEFYDRLDIHVSERGTVELTILDEDRNRAAAIANHMVTLIDSISQELRRPNRERVLALFETKYQSINKAYRSTRDSLQMLRKQSGLSGLMQEERYMARDLVRKQTELREARAKLAALKASGQGTGTLPAEVAGLEAAVNGLLYQKPGSNSLTLESFQRNNYLIGRLQAELDGLQTILVEARSAYEAARGTLSGRISTVYVLQPAFPVFRKAKPIRWLIVVTSTLAAFALMTGAVLVVEFLRRTRLDDWEEAPAPAAAWPQEKVNS